MLINSFGGEAVLLNILIYGYIEAAIAIKKGGVLGIFYQVMGMHDEHGNCRAILGFIPDLSGIKIICLDFKVRLEILNQAV